MQVQGGPCDLNARPPPVCICRGGEPAARSAFGSLAIGAPTTSRRVGVTGGQHPQECGSTAGAGRLASSTNPGDGAGPLKSRVYGGRLLTVLFAHRKKLPGSNATLTTRSSLHHSLGPSRNTYPSRLRHSWQAAAAADSARRALRGRCIHPDDSLRIAQDPPREAGVIRSIGPTGLTLSQSDELDAFFTRNHGDQMNGNRATGLASGRGGIGQSADHSPHPPKIYQSGQFPSRKKACCSHFCVSRRPTSRGSLENRENLDARRGGSHHSSAFLAAPGFQNNDDHHAANASTAGCSRGAISGASAPPLRTS